MRRLISKAAAHTKAAQRPRTSDVRSDRRGGTTIVELAVVLPVFTIFLAGLMEINHTYLVISTLKAAANKAARYGVADGVTTADVNAKALEVIAAAIPTDDVTILIKDASVFDTPGVDPDNINYNTLPAIELSDAEPRQLFIVRIEVNYDDVALLPPFFVKNATLSGQSVSRHE